MDRGCSSELGTCGLGGGLAGFKLCWLVVVLCLTTWSLVKAQASSYNGSAGDAHLFSDICYKVRGLFLALSTSISRVGQKSKHGIGMDSHYLCLYPEIYIFR